MAEIKTEKEPAIKDAERNAHFDSMLRVFESIIEGNPAPSEKIIGKLNSLKDSCKNTQLLTYRQADAIFARCDNYINGIYGVDKTKDAYLKQNKAVA